MPWGFVAGAAISAVGGVVASNKASKSQDKATAAQSRSADQAAQLGQDQLDFNKEQYYDQKPLRDQTSQSQLKLMDQQGRLAEQQFDISADYNNYNKGTFRPLEQQIVGKASGYDTPERRAAAEAEARASVESGYASSIGGLSRSLARGGITYGSGRSQALMQDAALTKAGALAGATTGASRNIETIGNARMMDAASLGRNLPSNQATAASTAIQAGNGSINAGTAAINNAAAGIPMVNTGYAGAIGAMGTAGHLYGQAAGGYGSMANAGANALGGLGSTVGNYFGRGGTMPSWGMGNTGYTSGAMPQSGYGYQNGSDIGWVPG